MNGQMSFRRWMPWLGIVLLAVMVVCGFSFGGMTVGLPMLVGGIVGGAAVLWLGSRRY